MGNLLHIANKLKNKDEFVSIVISILLFVVLTFFRPAWFLSENNFDSLQSAIAPSVIVAVGMMILLITGNLDLSVGSNMAVSGIVTGWCLVNNLPVWLSITCGLLCGAAIGLLNGFLVAKLKIIPLIATIGTMYVFRGISEMVMTGNSANKLTGFPQGFIKLGENKLFGLYYMTYVAIAVVIVFNIFLKNYSAGRKLYFIGGNVEGANFLGFGIKKVKYITFVLSGVLSALAAILSIARFQSVSRYLGKDIQMNIIIACIVGGGSLNGGKGSAVGALMGIIFITLLKNAFNLFEINVLWQSIVIGLMLIMVVIFDGYIFIKNQKLKGKR